MNIEYHNIFINTCGLEEILKLQITKVYLFAEFVYTY